jgi:hypothetical protein
MENEVCTRSAYDAQLIHASANAPTSVVGYHCKLPSPMIVPIDGELFLPGEQGFALEY